MKIKKIGAILAGVVMIGSAVAAAWNPSAHEDFFVDHTTGEPNAVVVVGAHAAAADVTAAAWIAAQIGTMTYKEVVEHHSVHADWYSGDDYDLPGFLLFQQDIGIAPSGYNAWALESLYHLDLDGQSDIDCKEPLEYIGMRLTKDQNGRYPYVPSFGASCGRSPPVGLVYGSLSNVANCCEVEVDKTAICPTCGVEEVGRFYLPTEGNIMHLLGSDYTVLDSFQNEDGDAAILFGNPTTWEDQTFTVGASVCYGGWEITVTDINLLASQVMVEIDNNVLNIHETKILNVHVGGDTYDYGEIYWYSEDLLPGEWNYCFKCTNNGCQIADTPYEGTIEFAIIPTSIFMGKYHEQVVMTVYTLEDPKVLMDTCCLQPCGLGNHWNLDVENFCTADDTVHEWLMGFTFCSSGPPNCVDNYDVGVFLELMTPQNIETCGSQITIPLCTFDPFDVAAFWSAGVPGDPYFVVKIDDFGDMVHRDPIINNGITVWQDIKQPDTIKKVYVPINPLSVIKMDNEVTNVDKVTKNLILVGGPGLVLQPDGGTATCNSLTKFLVDAGYSEVDWLHSDGEWEYIEHVFGPKDVLIVAGADREATRKAVEDLLLALKS